MDFNFASMKQRTKEIMKTAVPNMYILSLVMIMIFYIWIVSNISIPYIFDITEEYCIFGIMGILMVIKALFDIGYTYCVMKAAREEKGKIADLCQGFRKKPLKIILAAILRIVIIFVGYVFFAIPGIIFFYRSRVLYYVLLDDTDISIWQAFKRSFLLMKGNCMELFKLDLSFLAWHLLNIFSFGIASIYVRPFTEITYAEYYDYLKGKKQLME